MVFEGAIRKWLAPGLGTPLQVLRDLLPLVALVAFFVSRPPSALVKNALPNEPMVLSFVAYLVIGSVTAFASGQESNSFSSGVCTLIPLPMQI